MGIKKTVLFGDTSNGGEGHAYGVEFSNGLESFRVVGAVDLNAATYAHALAHGIAQKIGDAAALSKGATDAEKWAAMVAMRDQICGPDGEWNRRAEGSDTMLARAVAEWSGQPLADVMAQLKAQTKEFREALKKNEEIAAIIARYHAAKPIAEDAKAKAADFLAGLKKA